MARGMALGPNLRTTMLRIIDRPPTSKGGMSLSITESSTAVGGSHCCQLPYEYWIAGIFRPQGGGGNKVGDP